MNTLDEESIPRCKEIIDSQRIKDKAKLALIIPDPFSQSLSSLYLYSHGQINIATSFASDSTVDFLEKSHYTPAVVEEACFQLQTTERKEYFNATKHQKSF